MFLITCLAIVLVVATTLIHGFILAPAIQRLKQSRLGQAQTLTWVVLLIVFVHVVEAALYSGGFAIGAALDLGSFKQIDRMDWMDYLYFSLVNYNTLGLGDIYPSGHLRFLAGVEAVNGFLLISCSATFIFKLINVEAEG